MTLQQQKPFDRTLGIGLILCAILVIPAVIVMLNKPDQNAINISTFMSLGAFIMMSVLFFRTFGRVIGEIYEDDDRQKNGDVKQ